ncbi:PREDICTED: oocyte zinc finger protein XlCOF29-like [Nanorana parkeri]|uniref:oocyte zinc finger protein XlCOF29-like n=1 Tax=Nanorana parkeri TaxID=125878 RepID=UPI0008549029|nr:PREDICTED: oocyte zinc finger protein XlCOF29-like [Nanorana parkeri]
MADPQGTDEERKKVTKTILSLTLEIIYLLTGEDYTVVRKMSGDHVTPFSQSNVSRSKSPIMKPPPYSLILEGNTTGKILEVTQKIIELLIH